MQLLLSAVSLTLLTSSHPSVVIWTEKSAIMPLRFASQSYLKKKELFFSVTPVHVSMPSWVVFFRYHTVNRRDYFFPRCVYTN